MKIISREKGDTIKYFYLDIELDNGKEAEVSVIQNYHTNPDFSEVEVEILNAKDFTAKEIKEIKEFAEENYIEQ